MSPGEELDALIAEKVMGWDNNWDAPHGRGFPDMWGTMDYTETGPVRVSNFPPYSESIEAAWDLVGHVAPMAADDFALKRDGGDWLAYFRLADKGTDPYIDAEGHARAPTAPHAICLAALKAVGVEVPA